MTPPGGPSRNILFLHSSAGQYGADRQLALIARGLDPARYRPLVVLPEPGELAEALAAAGAEVLTRPLAVLRRSVVDPAELARLALAFGRDLGALRRLIRARDIALVHSNTSVVLGGGPAAAAAGVPHVWHVREIYTRFGRLWPPYRRLLLGASWLPCVSEATAGQFAAGIEGANRTLQTGDALPEPVSVLHDGLAHIPRPALRQAARAALSLPEGPPAVAVLGRISDWKGQDQLVRALATPALRDGGTLGILAGDPWPGAEERMRRIMDLSDRLGVRDRLHHVGFRPDVENVLGAAEVIAVPSTQPDPLPGAALEAAAAGCAVVAAAHGGLPEILTDGRTGRLVPPGDVQALASACAALISDPAERQRLARAAQEDVQRRFGADRLLGELQAGYDRVLRSRRR